MVTQCSGTYETTPLAIHLKAAAPKAAVDSYHLKLSVQKSNLEGYQQLLLQGVSLLNLEEAAEVILSVCGLGYAWLDGKSIESISTDIQEKDIMFDFTMDADQMEQNFKLPAGVSFIQVIRALQVGGFACE